MKRFKSSQPYRDPKVLKLFGLCSISSRPGRRKAVSILLIALDRILAAELAHQQRLYSRNDDTSEDEEIESDFSTSCIESAIVDLQDAY
jgi:hypothetical protein